jgi:hypothetical protein
MLGSIKPNYVASQNDLIFARLALPFQYQSTDFNGTRSPARSGVIPGPPQSTKESQRPANRFHPNRSSLFFNSDSIFAFVSHEKPRIS